jgi:hypothetical protein
MFGSNVLEVAIGIVFIYLLLSLICSAVNEWIASVLNQRGKNLFKGIKNLLNDPQFTGLAQQVYTHGLIQGISFNAADPKKQNRLPSYISHDNFSLALLDILGSKGASRRGEELVKLRQTELDTAKAELDAKPLDPELIRSYSGAKNLLSQADEINKKAEEANEAHIEAEKAASGVNSIKNISALQNASVKLQKALSVGRAVAEMLPDQLSSIEKGIESLPEGHTKESLMVLASKTKRDLSGKIRGAENELEILQTKLEIWFNNSMDRINGWYKRWTQKIILAVAAVLIIILNADTIMLVKSLSNDSVLRAAIVNAAEKEVAGSSVLENSEARKQLLDESKNLGIPFGWVPFENNVFNSSQVPNSFIEWLLKLLGLTLTIAAVSLGAPFWFDILKKIINVRGAGIPPGSSKKS